MKLSKLLIIGCICLIVSNFFVTFCVIHGESMYPTYKDKQIVLESKFLNKYARGEIVVIKKKNLKIIKRIVAIPNDTIIIKNNYVYVNDVKIDDFITEYSGTANSKITLKQDEYFVLGDNRSKSIDSRHKEIGIINKKEIKGKIISKKGDKLPTTDTKK